MFSFDDRSWRWGWDLPQSAMMEKEGWLEAAKTVRAIGKRQKIKELTRAYITKSHPNVGHTVGQTCLGLLIDEGYTGYYRCPFDTVRARPLRACVPQ